MSRARETDASEPPWGGWDAPDLAALLLMRVPPTDRALAGWDPGWWHLPDEPRKPRIGGSP